MDELTCRQIVELVTDYVEGALPPADRVRFEKHLVYCPGCVYYLDQMQKTLELVGELKEDDCSPEAHETFLLAFREWHAAEEGAS